MQKINPEDLPDIIGPRAVGGLVKADALKILSWQHIREGINANA